MSVITPDTLQSGLAIDQDSGNLTILHIRLMTDINDVAIHDACADHTVSFANKGKITVYAVRDTVVIFDIFYG